MNKQYSWKWVAIALALASAVIPELALAEIGQGLSAAQAALQTWARPISIMAVIGVGVGKLLGRLQWAAVISIVIGIVLIYGAATHVNMVAGWFGF